MKSVIFFIFMCCIFFFCFHYTHIRFQKKLYLDDVCSMGQLLAYSWNNENVKIVMVTGKREDLKSGRKTKTLTSTGTIKKKGLQT
ncbi:uncharacterized protein EV154DRAFT_492998 [Mucor mucedo]|uniref:uncharacterized protein n=1 Tax=Mucor mucedo TaxID=29922 RepID=UPI00221FA684|nr:uncharacterized protein EV154DRAFT_492998 [Mucor mucedo]KAI7896316.1 hypothetical protein EV154DRAFT_492998 [Mucor mucedo]